VPRFDESADVQRAQELLKKAEVLAHERADRLHDREIELAQRPPEAPCAFPRPDLRPLDPVVDAAEGLASLNFKDG